MRIKPLISSGSEIQDAFRAFVLVTILWSIVITSFMPTLASAVGLSITEIDAERGWRLETNGDTQRFGMRQIVGIGDVNGDGLGDIAISFRYTISSEDVVAVVYGKTSDFSVPTDIRDLDGSTGFILSTPIDPQRFGDYRTNLASVGDVNDDGVNDFAISIPGPRQGNEITVSNVAYVLFGRNSNWPARVDVTTLTATQGIALSSRFDQTVSAAGDINNDSVTDFLVCSNPRQDRDNPSCSLIFGESNLSSLEVPVDTASDGQRIFLNTPRRYPQELAIAAPGDVNGDGIDDLVIGVEYQPFLFVEEYSSAIVFGKSGPHAANLYLANLGAGTGYLLDGVADPTRAGDVNNDGINDIAFGDTMLFGQIGDFDTTLDINNLTPEQGYTIAKAFFADAFFVGDVNDDGTDDLAYGATQTASFALDPTPGSAYIVYGSSSNLPAVTSVLDLSTETGYQVDGFDVDDSIGGDVAALGDVNGDGIDDLAIGFAWRATDSTTQAYVVFGTPEGQPDYPASCGNGMFFDPQYTIGSLIWQDCVLGEPTGRWHVRESQGINSCERGCDPGPDFRDYDWFIESDRPITELNSVATENDDVVSLLAPALLSFSGIADRTRDAESEGIDFTIEDATSLCVTTRKPQYHLGGDRRASDPAFDIITGAACTPPDVTPSFQPGPLFVSENSPQRGLSLSLSPPPPVATTFNIATVAGTAQSGRDFYGQFTKIRFEAGQDRVHVPFTVIDDREFEGDEDLTLRIFESSDPRIADTQRTVIIEDNESPRYPDILIQDTSVDENAGVATVRITLSEASDSDIRLTAFTQPVTATGGGVDYRGFTQRILIPEGETERLLQVPIVDDTIIEETESFSVRLIDVVFWANVPNDTAVVRIRDDDEIE